MDGTFSPFRSPSVRKHTVILARLLKAKGLRQEDVARALGYKSPSAIGMMLRGERAMGREELEKMCELAGITILALAEQSDDLHLAKRAEAIEAAAIIDEMSSDDLARLMPLLRGYRTPKTDR